MIHVINISAVGKAQAYTIAGCRDGVAHWVRHALTCFVAMGLSLVATGHVLAGGVDHGAQIAATCASCHRVEAGERGIPPIVGLSEAKLTQALLAYRFSERPSHVMHAIALSLSDEDIAGVARFLAAKGKASPP